MEETETTEAPEDKESLISEESLSVAANEGESNKNDVSLQHSKSEHETNTTDNSQTEDHESAERKLQINESKGKNSISMTRKRPESKGSTPGITEQQPSELDDKVGNIRCSCTSDYLTLIKCFCVALDRIDRNLRSCPKYDCASEKCGCM